MGEKMGRIKITAWLSMLFVVGLVFLSPTATNSAYAAQQTVEADGYYTVGDGAEENFSVAREREQGTFDQLLVTPLSPTIILIGKAAVPVLMGMIQSTLVLLISLFWFRIPMAGSPLTLWAVLFVFTLSTTGIGLSISSISSSMQQVMVYCLLLLMPMILLSGNITPVANMPEILQIITYADPLRFALDSVWRIYLEGCGLADVAHNFVPMLGVAAVTFPLAGWLFRHNLG